MSARCFFQLHFRAANSLREENVDLFNLDRRSLCGTLQRRHVAWSGLPKTFAWHSVLFGVRPSS
jgi:hypothetical protein